MHYTIPPRTRILLYIKLDLIPRSLTTKRPRNLAFGLTLRFMRGFNEHDVRWLPIPLSRARTMGRINEKNNYERSFCRRGKSEVEKLAQQRPRRRV